MLADVAGSILKKDRLVVTVGLFAVIGLAWAYMVYMTASLGTNAVPTDELSITNLVLFCQLALQNVALPNVQVWSMLDIVFLFLMWTVMQVAMMTPTAAPMVLMFARIHQPNLWRAIANCCRCLPVHSS